MKNAVIIVSAFGITGIGALGCAFLGQLSWRRGQRFVVLAFAVVLAALAGGLYWHGSQMQGFLAGLGYVFAALMIWCGPVFGLLLGALIGWAMDRWSRRNRA